MGHYYNLFHSFEGDMAPAVDLQNLLTALAFKYMADGRVTHAHIPDNPFVESERRQMLKSILKDQDSSTFIQNTRQDVVEEKAEPEVLRKLISLLIVSVISDRRQTDNAVPRARDIARHVLVSFSGWKHPRTRSLRNDDGYMEKR